MPEKYFISFIVAIMLIAVLIVPVIYLRMRLKYLQNLVRINILKRQQKINQSTLFATDILNSCVRCLFFNFRRRARNALSALIAGKIDAAYVFLLPQHPQLAQLLQAHIYPDKAYKQMKRSKKTWLKNAKYGVYFAVLAYLMHDRQTLKSAISSLNACHIRKNMLSFAYYNYILAYTYLYEGDMLSASQNASVALKIFQKKQYATETALCHLALAEIYRISCVNDIAETMINSAIKIHQTQKAPLYTAQAIVAKGMLMVFENRLEEAGAQYEKALKMPITDQLRADIYNQTALLHLAQKNIGLAQKYASTALKMQQKLKNPYGQALSLQLIALAAFARGHHNKTVEFSAYAAKIYKKQQNLSAYAECLYLASEAQYKQHKLQSAEKNLRLILDLHRDKKSNFHPANAYSLLGMIYLQKHDLQRAKVLFQQSLYLEQSHQRCEGLAADYANLALIEEQTDNTETAAANWEIALKYAKQSGDTELEKLIEKKYNNRI